MNNYNKKSQNKDEFKIIKNQFYNVDILPIIKLGFLKFHPIRFNFRNVVQKLKSLDELFDRKLIRINEIDFDGSVGNVEVSNDSRYYLIILDGEAITGAKQNRISERAVIIAPYSSEIIPVNCVEKGRWNYNSQSFSKSDFVLHPSAREEKAELLKNREDHKIQDAVWNKIDELSDKHSVFSNTSDLGDILNKSDNKYDLDYFDKIKHLKFNGYVLEGAGRTFIEVFYDELVCKSNIKKSLRSWLADSDEKIILTKLNINSIINEFINSEWDQDESIAIEKNYISKKENNGRSFYFNENLIHSYYYI